MAAHAHASALRGGVLGVDVFFVLSGFLITTLLCEEREGTGRVRYGSFYVRRALRLLPALYAMLAVLAVYAAVASDVDERQAFLSIRSAGLYVANLPLPWVEWRYLTHTWSLSLEEQFYLVWPVTLAVLLRSGGRRLAIGVLMGVVVLFAAARLVGFHLPWGLVGQRPDALALGCLVALGAREWPRTRDVLARRGTGVAGLALLVVLVLAWGHGLSEQAYHRGLFTVVGCAAAIVVGHLAFGSGPLTQVASTRVAVEVGLLSYALYLWHIPVYRWVGGRLDLPGLVQIPLEVAITFVLAALSRVLVERPALRLKHRFEPPGRRGDPVAQLR